jgi:hypothetical protein
MELTITPFGNGQIAELVPGETIVRDVQDALDLIGNAGYQGATHVVVHETNLAPEFFDLKTRLAGEILQKFSNYGLRLAIVGDFAKFDSSSLRDFIRESNRTGRILFVESTEAAREAFMGK